ncbi:MAG: glycosyltransferase [Nitrospirae bacterium]|nr:glycosyltransferase [Nitrospirota bacterium]
MSEPLLSVCLITYNHAKYIREAIDGVLMQKVNFTWELIVADDFSTDGTREIVLEYARNYPAFIKLILQERNVGAAQNWMDLMAAPSGKYIAYFEGDDFWTDPSKLQRQVDALENNTDLAGCFSNAIIVDDNGQIISVDYFAFYNKKVKPEIRTEDIVPFGMSPSNSLVFRREILVNPPDWFARNSRHSGLDLLITLHGILYCINEKLGAYRIRPGGSWSLAPLSTRLMSDLLFLKPLYQDEHMYRNHGPVIIGVIKNEILCLLELKHQQEACGTIVGIILKLLFSYPRNMSFFILLPYWIFKYFMGKIVQKSIRHFKTVINIYW